MAISDKKQYMGVAFDKYVESIREFSDEFFDVVFIDGRARVACLEVCQPKLKRGGMIVLDNWDRDAYKASVIRLREAGWPSKEFSGLTPGILAWDSTIVLWRPG